MRHGRAALVALALASLGFYAYWDWRNVLVLGGSILVNFAAGAVLKRRPVRGALAAAITLNLVVLGYFKYAGFLVESISLVTGPIAAVRHVLPLGISFFTFTQIAFLVDCYRGLASELNFTRYFLFVTFFPHIIAGPIVHHGDIMPQFAAADGRRWQPGNVGQGLTLFCLGLTKKVAIADMVGPWANAVFAHATAAPPVTISWFGALAYTFQLYFDFSGYSDMAVGLALLFNVRMPDNFDAPYRAESPIEFWKRWHMTLSRFLRDYLYIPLGGSRKGEVRRYANLMATMVLGGLWHGAGWTYVLWGTYHGVLLCVAHLWLGMNLRPVPRPAARLLTFLAVVVGWVVFRATDVAQASSMLGSMFFLRRAGHTEIPAPTPGQWATLAALLAFVNVAPTSAAWLASGRASSRWRAVVLGVLFVIDMLMIRDAQLTHAPNLFIYFQF